MSEPTSSRVTASILDLPAASGTSEAAVPDFYLTATALRARSNGKWSMYGPNVLPAFVAEMDFRVAPPVQQAIDRLVAAGDYGYPMKSTVGLLAEAFSARMQARYGWSPDPAFVQSAADLVQGLYAQIMAFSDPGDGILLHVPCYPPFRDSVVTTKRRPLPIFMRDGGERYSFVPAEIEAAIDGRTRMFLLCNPQNPTGRVFTRAELMTIADIAMRHDLIVVSDEIHGDLAFSGHRHIPFASLGPDVAARTVTLVSATKSFNIPGMRTALIHFGSQALWDRFLARVPSKMLGRCNSIGVEATIAAMTQGQPWLDAVLAHLEAMRDHIGATLARELPDVRWHPPEATFLAWLDFSRLKLNGPAYEFFLREAQVALSAGESFDPSCAAFSRLNFATSRPILDDILDRMITAVRHRP